MTVLFPYKTRELPDSCSPDLRLTGFLPSSHYLKEKCEIHKVGWCGGKECSIMYVAGICVFTQGKVK